MGQDSPFYPIESGDPEDPIDCIHDVDFCRTCEDARRVGAAEERARFKRYHRRYQLLLQMKQSITHIQAKTIAMLVTKSQTQSYVQAARDLATYVLSLPDYLGEADDNDNDL